MAPSVQQLAHMASAMATLAEQSANLAQKKQDIERKPAENQQQVEDSDATIARDSKAIGERLVVSYASRQV